MLLQFRNTDFSSTIYKLLKAIILCITFEGLKLFHYAGTLFSFHLVLFIVNKYVLYLIIK